MRIPTVRTPFIPTILVIILGVNLGAWTLSVATSPNHDSKPVTIPIGAPAINEQAQSASVAAAQTSPNVDIASSSAAIGADATTSPSVSPTTATTITGATRASAVRTQ